MLETVRRIMMRRFVSKRLAASKWKNLVCPKIRERLGVNIERSRKMTHHWAGEGHFEVQGSVHSHVVDLNKGTCDCREWQLTGLPCRHACSCLSFLRRNIELYTYEGYYVSRFAQAYEGTIFPIPDSSTWPVLPLEKVIPYNIIKKVGRPKKARRRAPDEPRSKGRVSRVGTIITCKKCKQPGHNSRGCRNQNPASTAPPPPPISRNTSRRGRGRGSSRGGSSRGGSNRGGRPRSVPRHADTQADAMEGSSRGGRPNKRGRKSRGAVDRATAATVQGSGDIAAAATGQGSGDRTTAATDQGGAGDHAAAAQGAAATDQGGAGDHAAAASAATAQGASATTDQGGATANQGGTMQDAVSQGGSVADGLVGALGTQGSEIGNMQAAATHRKKAVAKKRKFKEVQSRYQK